MPKDLQDTIQSIKNIPDLNPKQEKAVAILEQVAFLKDVVLERAKLLSKKKRIFPKVNRKPKRKQKAVDLFRNSTKFHAGIMRLMSIQAQPIPKFPKGWNDEHKAVVVNGGAYVVEHGEEIIINRSSSHYGDYQPKYTLPITKGELDRIIKHKEELDAQGSVRVFRFTNKDLCDHVFGTKTVDGNWHGSMKAVCIKCGYEP